MRTIRLTFNIQSALENRDYVKALRLLAVNLLVALFFSVSVFGQNAQHTDNKADQVLRGSGRVNPSSLGMEFQIDLGNYPGRGISVPVNISYSSKVWRLEYERSDPQGNNPGVCITKNRAKYGENSASGWTTSMAFPYIEYTGEDNLFDENGFPVNEVICPTNQPVPYYRGYIKRITVRLPSGETHELRASDEPVLYPAGQLPPFDWNATFYTVDGSNLRYIEDASRGLYRLLMPDGSFYDFSHERGRLDLTTIRKADRFTDRNGNSMTYYSPGSVDSSGVAHPNGYWKDTLGRNIPVPFKPEAPVGPTVQEYRMPGLLGAYRFHWKRLKGSTPDESGLSDFSQQLQYTYALFPKDSQNEVIDSTGVPFNPIVLTAVELPTGQLYRFRYNIYGEINQIYYPTGGEEHFTYGIVPPLGDTGAASSNQPLHWSINRGVQTRKVYVSAGSSFLEWAYSATLAGNHGYMVTITAPDETFTQRLLHRGYDNCTGCTPSRGTWGYDNILSGMAYEERSFSNTGRLLTRKLTHWAKTSFPNYGLRTKDWHPRVTQEETIIYDEDGDALSTTTRQSYVGDLNRIETPLLNWQSTQYAFLPIPASSSLLPDEPPDPDPTPVPTPIPPNPIRTTETTYLIYDAVNYPDPEVRNSYKNRNLIGLVTVSVIRDGSGVVVSRQETRYDEADASPAYRGNPTTTRVWANSKGGYDSPLAYISTRAIFDEYGSQVESIDVRGNSTVTEYDAVHHAFPIKVIMPIPDPDPSHNPDGIPHGSQSAFVATATFDYVTGLPLTTTNINGMQTRMEYDPVTLRLKKVSSSYAGQQVGGESETFYNDQPNNYWIKNKTQIDADKYAETTTYFDGLGRAYKSEQKNSRGNIFVEKEFDSEGRIKRVTNPFRNGETRQWTTNVYDEASRIIEVILPGGSKVKTAYGLSMEGVIGVSKTVTDQAGKKRRGISDALGRMLRVIEDPGGQNLSTDYVFDTLGNLRKTTQGEQNRYFSYDSLSRLLRAKQPEQEANPALALAVPDAVTNHNEWSMKYEYDDSGNLASTTDSRNIRIAIAYDRLNRPIYRNYYDSTPDVSLYYDGTGLGAVPEFSRGKLTRVSNSVSETRYTSFDILGRLLSSQQLTTGAQRDGTEEPYTSTYTYNLSGAPVSETYPSGRVVTNQYDQDGMLGALWGLRPNEERPLLYLDQFSYNADGAIEAMLLGNGLWERAEYNERLQITKIALGSSMDDNSYLQLDYNYGGAAQNNGSLREQKISYGGLSSQIVQTYSYDALNRLQSATESYGSGAQSWKQTFLYDRFSNRRFEAKGTTTLDPTLSLKITNPVINSSDNRLKKYQDGDTVADYDYDKAGNLTLDAENRRFIYNAENQQVSFFSPYNSSRTPDAVYQYDGNGRRVRKVVGGSAETIFVYNAGGQLIAEYSNILPEKPKINYLTADQLGSPRVITDQQGKVVSRHDYMAYGDEVLPGTANRSPEHGYGLEDDINQQYTGYERDDESGLDYAQARYYNSRHGRFTSVDPSPASASTSNPQTFNRYSYALNSPYEFVDPLGLISESAACGMRCQNSGGYLTGEGMTSWARDDGFDVTVEWYPGTIVQTGDTEFPLPAAVHELVNKANEVYRDGFTFEPDQGDTITYEAGSVEVAPVLQQVVDDATWAYNRAKQERVLFEAAMQELEYGNEVTWMLCGQVPTCQWSNSKPQLPTYTVGQLIPIAEGQVQIGTGDYPGGNLTFKAESPAVKAYNDYVTETNRQMAERREAFVGNNVNTLFNVRVTPIRGGILRGVVAPTKLKITLGPETLRKIHTRRVNLGRNAGYR